MRLLIFGHGYAAGEVTRAVTPRGWQVAGTTRGDLARVRAAGAEAILWPGDEDRVRAEIGRADAILASAGPGPGGDPVLAAWGDEIAGSGARWLGYFSTTAVYGDHAGAWVDEDTAPTPTTDRGRARVAAEQDWAQLAERMGVALHIFRLAGIYGPGRGPFAKLREGTARRILKPGQVFSRIHVEDIGRTVAAALDHPHGGVWNVCDDEPAPPEDVIAHAAELLGLPVPPAEPWDDAQMGPMARSFYSESKRVRNDRLRRDLGVTLAYPDYRTGLAAVLAEEAKA